LVLAALVAAVAQITLGGVVRVTGSGLGCPDWPLCHGQIVPPLEAHSLIEYSHRMSASLLGVLVIAGVALSWRIRRSNPFALVSMAVALVLVIVAAALGAAVVVTELSWWVVLFHLALAEGVVGCITVASVAGWTATTEAPASNSAFAKSSRLRLLMGVTLLATFALVLSGSYMVGHGYGSSCATWPLCRGALLPGGEAGMVHMAHRYIAAGVGSLIVALTVMAWRNRVGAHVRWATVAVLGLFVIQGLLGAATVWTGFTTGMRSIHLAAATLVWVALVYSAAICFPVRRFRLGPLGTGAPLSRLEVAAP
jgi:heme A synthase